MVLDPSPPPIILGNASRVSPFVCVYIRTYIYTYTYICSYEQAIERKREIYRVHVGEDSWDPLSCRSFSTKEPLNIGHLCGKWPVKIRHPMSLRRAVVYKKRHLESFHAYIYTCIHTYIHIYLYVRAGDRAKERKRKCEYIRRRSSSHSILIYIHTCIQI